VISIHVLVVFVVEVVADVVGHVLLIVIVEWVFVALSIVVFLFVVVLVRLVGLVVLAVLGGRLFFSGDRGLKDTGIQSLIYLSVRSPATGPTSALSMHRLVLFSFLL